MDHKRELTSVDLAALEAELGAYTGAKLDKAYLYSDDDLIRLKMRDFDRGRVEFIIELGDVKQAHVADVDHVPDAPGRPPDFAMMLRNRLSGADLVRVEQFEFDRILELEFERGDGSTTLVAELFGDGNLAVLDSTGKVLDCLETVRLKSRTVAPGSQYEFPSARFNPLTVDYDGFVARIRESDADLVRTLATQLNFGGLYGEELCSRAGIDYNVAVDELTDDQLERVYEVVSELEASLKEGRLDPRVYYEEIDGETDDGESQRRRVDVTPVPLEEYDHLYSESFDSFNAALDDYFFNFQREEEVEGGGTQRPDFESEISKYEHIIQQQQEAIDDFQEQADAEREKAELLYARYDLVDEVLSTIQSAREDDVPWDDIAAKFREGADQGIPAAEAVVDLDGSEGTVTLSIDDTQVTVDATVGVEKNADELYTEAKRIEGKKEGALTAIEDTREDLEAVKERREEWEADDSEPEETPDDEDEHEPTDWLNEPSIPIRKTEQWYERFRWFHTSDGFLVLGGRDADDNEALVQKYLEGGDKFFHAQAHGAPVTVLKATGPSESSKDVDFPQSSLDEAAKFAASYSSVWKAGRFAGDVYMVDPDQVSKTPESGEYLEKGGFAVRGDRTYFDDTPVSVAVGITCEDRTEVIGGPPAAIRPKAATSITVEPGQYAQNDIAKRLYREFKERFTDETFVRKVASPDKIQEFLPPGGSRMVDE